MDAVGEHIATSFEDLERWLLDPNEEIRNEAVFTVTTGGPTPLSRLVESDKRRFVSILGMAAELYEWMPLLFLSQMDYGWVDVFWDEMGRLLDLGKQHLNSVIICGELESLLCDGKVAPGDAKLSGWINGDSIERKMALLSVVQWFGMREEWQRKITEALANDENEVVSSTARCFLCGKAVPDIQDRMWAK
jgi:hypothetical protein